jgi:hypothetical protein
VNLPGARKGVPLFFYPRHQTIVCQCTQDVAFERRRMIERTDYDEKKRLVGERRQRVLDNLMKSGDVAQTGGGGTT